MHLNRNSNKCANEMKINLLNIEECEKKSRSRVFEEKEKIMR